MADEASLVGGLTTAAYVAWLFLWAAGVGLLGLVLCALAELYDRMTARKPSRPAEPAARSSTPPSLEELTTTRVTATRRRTPWL
ncbi:hypothetical protein [Prauserella flavalba]|uniref:hypothetical protein n=1 Tax=Prauserella flavalba TaxID=1477506 RepID=UPI0036EC6901